MRCKSCFGRGYLHVQGWRHGDESTTIACDECIAGKQWDKKMKQARNETDIGDGVTVTVVPLETILQRPKKFPQAQTDAEWNAVFAYLRGDDADRLTTAQHIRIRKYADGFGMPTEPTTNPNIFWDWSHVRDSTPEAIHNMFNELRKIMPHIAPF